MKKGNSAVLQHTHPHVESNSISGEKAVKRSTNTIRHTLKSSFQAGVDDTVHRTISMWGSEVEQQDSRLASPSTNRFRALSAGHNRHIADETSACAPDSRETG